MLMFPDGSDSKLTHQGDGRDFFLGASLYFISGQKLAKEGSHFPVL